MTTGPWRPISLHTYKGRITDLRVRTEISESLDTSIDIGITFSFTRGEASIVLKDDGGNVVRKAVTQLEGGKAHTKFMGTKGEFHLWYPVGYGKQPIYTAEVQVADEVCMSWGSIKEM